MLIGDKKKFLSVLVTLRVVINPDTLIPTKDIDPSCKQLLNKSGISSMNLDDVMKEKNVRKMIQES